MLTTKTKVSLAALAYRYIAMARAMVGKDDCVTVSRGDLRWCLDLSEGIDFSIYLFGAFERSTAVTLRKLVKPGDVVFDIGANIGAHTLGLARSAGPTGRVFAFEPADFAFAKLKRNLALNPALEARTHPRQILLAAAPAEHVQQEIYASWPLRKDNSVHAKHRGRLVTARNASVDTLDRFVECESIDRLNLIKIDVDGHELPLLQGGLKLLTKFRPVLVMEMSPYVHAEQHHSFSALVALLRDAGYSLQDANNWAPLPLQAGELEARIPDGASINVIARFNGRMKP
ncbi:MAG TPA: FkbM family methyltransferase [Candidatus Dormibacteraeota bacterium]|nr:FkbM family methyltransferase [Candidatus Dormibacteraeota bacterium]